MRHISGEEGRALAGTATGVKSLYDSCFEFALPDGRTLTYEVRGSSSSHCDTCGYGSELIVDWTLHEKL